MKKYFLIFYLLALNVSLANGQSHPYVLSTTGMVGDLVKRLLPEHHATKVLIGAGVDPHLFKPTRSDMVLLLRSQAVFYSGNYLEGRMIDAIKKLDVIRIKNVAVTERLPKELLLESEHFLGNFDPHIWMDPVLWKDVSLIIKNELVNLFPSEAESINNNSILLVQDLERLDSYIKNSIQTINQNSRILITAHDAFEYFGRRYGLKVMGIQGISTDSEASVMDIEKLVKVIVDHNVKSVFVESTVSEKNINALIEGVRAKNASIEIGGKLFSDAMGKEGAYLGTYIGMIDHNVTTIVRGLGGNAPQGGMNNLLRPED